MKLNITISVGDFIDRLSILTIKMDNNLFVDDEFEQYQKVALSFFGPRPEFAPKSSPIIFWMTSYKHYLEMFLAVNRQLWDLEDLKRSPSLLVGSEQYIETSELITHLNDLRYQIKKSADQHFGSDISEKKSHE